MVNTPYYMTENDPGSFSKTEKGYELTLPGLPEKELTFTLSEADSPKLIERPAPFDPIIFVAGFVLIGGAVIAVALMVKRKKDRGKERP